MDIVVISVVGYGRHYLNELLDADDGEVRLVGAVDPAIDRCERLDELRRRGVPLYTDLAEFYRNSGADLAIMSPPIHLHGDLIKLALANGSHVLCEKPLTPTIQEARDLIDARQRADRMVGIGYQWSFSPPIQSLKADIAAGFFGTPLRMKTCTFWPRPRAYFRRNNWAARLRDADGRWILDSPVMNATAHFLHNCFYVLGKDPQSSAAPSEIEAQLHRAREMESYDTAALRCLIDRGPEMLFYVSHAVKNNVGPVLEYQFEHGTVRAGGDAGGDFVARMNDGREKNYGDPFAYPMTKLWSMMDSIRTGKPVLCGIEASCAHTLAADGAMDSCPIRDFPADRLRTSGLGDSEVAYVEGLEDTLWRCYLEHRLPSEMGIDWAQAGRRVDLRGYRSFPGGA